MATQTPKDKSLKSVLTTSKKGHSGRRSDKGLTPTTWITEQAVTWIAPEIRIEGKIYFDQVARVHGQIRGQIEAAPGSTLILTETAYVEGDIQADTLFIDGFVRGDIVARTKVVISGTGRVLGNIESPSVSIDFGAHFEGQCKMESYQIAPA